VPSDQKEAAASWFYKPRGSKASRTKDDSWPDGLPETSVRERLRRSKGQVMGSPRGDTAKCITSGLRRFVFFEREGRDKQPLPGTWLWTVLGVARWHSGPVLVWGTIWSNFPQTSPEEGKVTPQGGHSCNTVDQGTRCTRLESSTYLEAETSARCRWLCSRKVGLQTSRNPQEGLMRYLLNGFSV